MDAPAKNFIDFQYQMVSAEELKTIGKLRDSKLRQRDSVNFDTDAVNRE